VTDAQGRTVDFKNTVIILTSNIGSQYLLEGVSSEGEIREEAGKAVMAELRHHFRPEFLNRVDDIVLFKPLSREEIKSIIHLLATDLRKRLADRRIGFEITEAACDFIAREAYDPVYGARPLKRYLQHHLETRIGRALIGGDIHEGATIKVDEQGGELVVTPMNP
jgi:ATP-dependent Clp protease ATP-binding subunit ClpB